MLDISIWKFVFLGTVLLLLVFFLFAGYGVIKLKYLNSKWLRELKTSRANSDDPAYKNALRAVIYNCQTLNSKWFLEESDLDILENTYQLLKKIAHSYHPDSRQPLEEAKIRRILNAFIELKDHLLEITTWKGIHTATQFRIRHIKTISRAWELKKSCKVSKTFIFFEKYKLSPFFKWPFYILRCLDLIFWSTKMFFYITQEIVFKVFLMRWYLLTGKLAIQVYSDREKDLDIKPEAILDDLNLMSEYKNLRKKNLSEKIQNISESSRNKILYHTWSVQWSEVKIIYINLIEGIAREYNPQAAQPIYEAKLFELLTCGVLFFENFAAIGTYPFFKKLLNLRVTHVLIAKDTVNFLKNSQVLSWVRKYKLTYIFKYSSLLYKVVEKKHPGLIFRDFAIILVGEGCKRWFYLYLNDRITIETNTLYLRSRTATRLA